MDMEMENLVRDVGSRKRRRRDSREIGRRDSR